MTDFTVETIWLVNILRANFSYVFIDLSNVKIPFEVSEMINSNWLNEVIFSKRLLFELRQKIKCILK